MEGIREHQESLARLHQEMGGRQVRRVWLACTRRLEAGRLGEFGSPAPGDGRLVGQVTQHGIDVKNTAMPYALQLIIIL